MIWTKKIGCYLQLSQGAKVLPALPRASISHSLLSQKGSSCWKMSSKLKSLFEAMRGCQLDSARHKLLSQMKDACGEFDYDTLEKLMTQWQNANKS